MASWTFDVSSNNFCVPFFPYGESALRLLPSHLQAFSGVSPNLDARSHALLCIFAFLPRRPALLQCPALNSFSSVIQFWKAYSRSEFQGQVVTRWPALHHQSAEWKSVGLSPNVWFAGMLFFFLSPMSSTGNILQCSQTYVKVIAPHSSTSPTCPVLHMILFMKSFRASRPSSSASVILLCNLVELQSYFSEKKKSYKSCKNYKTKVTEEVSKARQPSAYTDKIRPSATELELCALSVCPLFFVSRHYVAKGDAPRGQTVWAKLRCSPLRRTG